MRTSCGTVQQALTPEALSIVKQAIALARRRGHVQVTPLHVANTMLTDASSLLRTACLKSNSHPLQCKALDLCFNVALNRLPASSSSPMLGGAPSLQHLSVSNALIAAFKRAQAHQRRGSIENQQQPILAVKIELEQLIISILDDPSVSRVMREAGFSSTQVKTNVEQAVSLEITSQLTSSSTSKEVTSPVVLSGQSSMITQFGEKRKDPVKNEDIEVVLENLMSKKIKNLVFVGECISSVENVIEAAIEKVEKKEVPEALREVKCINLSLSMKLSLASIKHLSRAEVEEKLLDLTNLVRRCLGKGVVLYLGDLIWICEDRESRQGREFYSPLEHMIMELGKLIYEVGASERFWLVGIATFHTYMKFNKRYPSPDIFWCLNPVIIPAGSLQLSLSTVSDLEIHYLTEKIQTENGEGDNQLTSCKELSANFAIEGGRRSLQSNASNSVSITSTLPAWLQQYKNERLRSETNDQICVPVSDLCGEKNSISNSREHYYPNSPEKNPTLYSSLSLSSTICGFSHEQQLITASALPLVEPRQSLSHGHYRMSVTQDEASEPNLRIYLADNLKQPFSTNNPDSVPTPASSTDQMETEYTHKFKEFNSENLSTLCYALEKKVPWQKNIIPEIARTILLCRSGRVRRKRKSENDEQIKEETWLFFQGIDGEGKEKIAREIARLVFGSQSENFISIALSSFSTTKADSTDNDYRNKRSRNEQSCSHVEKFAEAVSSNPHRVFLVEDVEQADYCSHMGFKRAIEGGRIINSNGEEVCVSDAIIILSCDSFSLRSRACSPPVRHRREGPDLEEKEETAMEETTAPSSLNLDLNISINHEDGAAVDHDCSIDDIGLLDSVDRKILFKFQELRKIEYF